VNEPTHLVRIVGRTREGAADVVVVETRITPGESSALSLGPALLIYSPILAVEAIKPATSSDPFDLDLDDATVAALPVEVWRFFADVLDTASTRYVDAAREDHSGTMAASLLRTSERADRMAAAIRRAIGDDE